MNSLIFAVRKNALLKNAEVAQLVEHNLAKVGVAGSNLVFRSKFHHEMELFILDSTLR